MAHYTDSKVKIMTDCHDTCLQAVSHCLDTGGDHARTQHITLLLDCAEICQTEANFMLRNSELHASVCAVCAEICDCCAEDGERLAAGDEMMRECAQICRRCADACQEIYRYTGRPRQAA